MAILATLHLATVMDVVWDYHVVLVHRSVEGEVLVYDLDTVLPFPVALSTYLKMALMDEDQFPEQFPRMFRVVPASDYLELFSSDRQHMKDPTGDWLQPPPAWSCIRGVRASETHNLDTFISMERGSGVGDVISLTEFTRYFL